MSLDLYATLGLFITLIVVNCIVLGRAEAFAAKNNALSSMFDGIGMGLGFTIALTLLGAVREFWVRRRYSTCQSSPKNMVCFLCSCSGCVYCIWILIALINSLKKAN